jgi:2',3'-cyclic-nucleotide 2'-phosphodiesterase/3'-nucleotidase
VLSYDYYKLQADPSIGLERTATLIAQARAEFPNNLLLDNGDAMQGTALADYQALVPVACGQPLAIYKAMNQLGVDGGGIGNHEFNYGLAYLNQVTASHFDVDGVPAGATLRRAALPIVLANIYSEDEAAAVCAIPHPDAPDQRHRPRWQAADGHHQGRHHRLAPPASCRGTSAGWTESLRRGRARETAQKYIPQMRAEGADLVVAISHGGLDGAPYTPRWRTPTTTWRRCRVDAMLIGHAPAVPGRRQQGAGFNLPGVDKVGHGLRRARRDGQPVGQAPGRDRPAPASTTAALVVDKSRTTVEARARATRTAATSPPIRPSRRWWRPNTRPPSATCRRRSAAATSA